MNESGAPTPPPADDAVWAPPTPAKADAGSLLAGYRDFTVVARGGDSIVYRAHQDALDRDVAVKVVLLDDPESIARFRRELAITVRLGRQHPNIMTVLATGTTTDGQPCLVMDYVELGSLQNRLTERGPLPVSEVVAAGTVVADALAFAHGQGVLHRDVKPQNVLVLPTSYVLADFGLARAIDAGHSSSLERFSYRHAAPQTLDGEAPTVADDIYSLGSTLFTLLDGRPPFAADDPDEDSALSYLRRARTEQPRRLRRDDIPPALVETVMRCLARERTERFATADDLRAALSAVPTENRSWSPVAPAETAPPAPVAPPTAPPPELAAFAPPSTPAPPTPAALSTPAAATAPPATPAPPATSAPSAPPAPTPAPATLPAQPAALAQPAARAPVSAEPPTQQPSDPVAVSALAHLPGQPSGQFAAPDIDATGLRPVPETPPAAPPAPPAAPSRRRWYVISGIALAALAAGIVLGLNQGGGSSPPSPSPSTSQHRSTAVAQPSISTAAPISSFSPTAPVQNATPIIDPRYKPKITQLSRRNDGTVLVRWVDPTKGQLSFVIYLADTNLATTEQRPLLAAPARGQTATILTNVPAGHHCIAVSTIAQNETTDQVMLGLGPPSCLSS